MIKCGAELATSASHEGKSAEIPVDVDYRWTGSCEFVAQYSKINVNIPQSVKAAIIYWD